MSFEFLAPDAIEPGDGFAPLARSPMERSARAAGARFEVRDGWNVAVGYADAEHEREALQARAGFADVSHLGKLEAQAGPDDLAAIVARCAGGAELEPGTATRAAAAWWCPVTREKVLVLCEPAALPGLRASLEEAAAAAAGLASVVELTTAYAALTIAGPLAREVFARFCALDLRPSVTPVDGFRPGSVARTPGIVLREDEERYLTLVGAALGQYLWTVVADAAGHLGGEPVGVDALEPLAERTPQEAGHA